MYRILIVEDDMGIAGAIRRLTEAWDLEAKVCGGFPQCAGGFRTVQSPSGAAGYISALLQRLSLVHGNTEGIQGPDHFYFFRFR